MEVCVCLLVILNGVIINIYKKEYEGWEVCIGHDSHLDQSDNLLVTHVHIHAYKQYVLVHFIFYIYDADER